MTDELSNGRIMGLAVKWWALLTLLGALSGGLALMLKPTWLGFERKIFVASHQYQESHSTALAMLEDKKAALAAEAAKTENPKVRAAVESQMRAVEKRIKNEKRKLGQ